MKFRKGGSPVIPERAEPEGELVEFEASPRDLGRGRWSTAFLIVGSALVGATALAFWNRRTIANMRAQIQEQSDMITTTAPIDEEIF
jgi:hypothetical protein